MGVAAGEAGKRMKSTGQQFGDRAGGWQEQEVRKGW